MDGTTGPFRLPDYRLMRTTIFDATGARLVGCPRTFDEMVDRPLTDIAYDPESFPVAGFLPWSHPADTRRTARVACPDGRTLVLWFRVVGDACLLEFVALHREQKDPS